MIKKIIFAVIAVLTASAACACSAEESGFLKITVLKIGKADAIIINSQSGAVLIDAGEEDDGAEILEKARARGIEKLDYMIITHYDKDHVGGAAEVIAGMEIGEIIEPGYKKDSGEYNAYVSAAEKAGVKRTVPSKNLSFELDGAVYDIFMPKKSSYANENDYSIAVKVKYAGLSALFAGDALDARTAELEGEKISANVLKVPHHGSFQKGNESFFKAVGPQYALITCSDKNPADSKTSSALIKAGSEVLMTSDGDIEIIFSDKGIEAFQ